MTIEIDGNKLNYEFVVDEDTGERHVVIKRGREAKGDLVIPEMIDGCPVMAIGDSSFFCCAGLTSVKIPDGVTYIGHLAFRSCTGLTSVAIPDSVKCIEHRAFNGCTGLTSVSIGKGVARIAGEVFCGCRKLSDVTIHGNVSDLGLYAFAGCDKLADSNGFFVRGGVLYGYFGGGGEIAVPTGVTRIAPGVFYGRRELTGVTMADGLISIGAQAFCCCGGLKRVTIPKSVTKIGEGAFSGCKIKQ